MAYPARAIPGLALCLGILASAALAQEQEPAQTVKFPSVGGEALQLVGHLRRSDGAGPFPAVVLLHGCGGDWRGMDSRWGTRLVEWGYVALSVDSYGPRGIKTMCGNFWADPPDHMFDAYGALSFLAAQPFVAADCAAVMGASGGATMALMGAALQSERNVPDKFRAAVALYPDCRHIDGPMTIPTLILSGQLDGVTPAKFCQELTHNGSQYHNIRLIVFPGAYHAFDNISFPSKTPFLGSWLEYNANATAGAVGEIREFLLRNLRE